MFDAIATITMAILTTHLKMNLGVCEIEPWAQLHRAALKHKSSYKHNKITLTRIKLPAKLTCHKYNFWLVSCSFLLSRQLLSNNFCSSSSIKFGSRTNATAPSVGQYNILWLCCPHGAQPRTTQAIICSEHTTLQCMSHGVLAGYPISAKRTCFLLSTPVKFDCWLKVFKKKQFVLNCWRIRENLSER